MIEILKKENLKEFTEAVNTFTKDNAVFATQTHITPIITDGTYKLIYTAVIFYK